MLSVGWLAQPCITDLQQSVFLSLPLPLLPLSIRSLNAIRKTEDAKKNGAGKGDEDSNDSKVLVCKQCYNTTNPGYYYWYDIYKFHLNIIGDSYDAYMSMHVHAQAKGPYSNV